MDATPVGSHFDIQTDGYGKYRNRLHPINGASVMVPTDIEDASWKSGRPPAEGKP